MIYAYFLSSESDMKKSISDERVGINLMSVY